MTDLGSSEDSTWSVLILNDDDTPMEFVVNAIEQFFDMDRKSAIRLMLCIHSEGTAECGTYSHEIAKAKGHAGGRLFPQTSASASMRCRAQAVSAGLSEGRFWHETDLAPMLGDVRL